VNALSSQLHELVFSVVIESLTRATWYFATTALSATGAESAYSTEVSTTIP